MNNQRNSPRHRRQRLHTLNILEGSCSNGSISKRTIRANASSIPLLRIIRSCSANWSKGRWIVSKWSAQRGRRAWCLEMVDRVDRSRQRIEILSPPRDGGFAKCTHSRDETIWRRQTSPRIPFNGLLGYRDSFMVGVSPFGQCGHSNQARHRWIEGPGDTRSPYEGIVDPCRAGSLERV